MKKGIFEICFGQDVDEFLVEWPVGELLRQTARITKRRAGVCSPRMINEDLEELVWEYNVECDDGAPGGWDSLYQIDAERVRKEKITDPNRWHVFCFCECLAGDTKIPLLDGRILTMEEIFKEYGTDKSFWVFASDENGDFVPAKARSLGITKRVRRLIKVVLDNDEAVKCSSEHLFRLRDGSYKRADELQVNDSLMPLYLSEQKPNSRYSQFYLKVLLNSRTRADGRPIWKMVHRVVAERLLNKEFDEKKKITDEDYLIVHHKDFDTFNNTPENLVWLGKKEHWFLHATGDKTNAIKAITMMWNDQSFRKKQTEKNRMAGKISQKLHPENKVTWQKAGIAFMRSEAGRGFARKQMLKTWSEKRELLLSSRKPWTPERRKLLGMKLKECWTDERRENQRKRMIQLNKTLPRDERGYNNHKVKSVEVLEFTEDIPLFDLLVEDYHNYALAAGVFVHNCPAFTFWGSEYLAKRNRYLYGKPVGTATMPRRNIRLAPGTPFATTWVSNLVCKHIAAVLPELIERWKVKAKKINSIIFGEE